MIPIPFQKSFNSFDKWFEEIRILYPDSLTGFSNTQKRSWQSVVNLLRLRIPLFRNSPIPTFPLYGDNDWKQWINDFAMLNPWKLTE